MTDIFAKSVLIDGPLMSYAERRARLILQMAGDLLEAPPEVVWDECDSRRYLHNEGYNVIDVMMLEPDARHEAHQRLIAKVISDE